MHPEEVRTDAALVRRLLEARFPAWAELPIERLETSGTVNALYRLGDRLAVRLPRTDWGRGAVERELRWLPELARRLPVDVPVPLAKGAPAEGYPYEWGVYPWLDGEHPAPPAGEALARELAAFVRALHAIRLPGAPSSGRGTSLARFAGTVRAALAELGDEIDAAAADAAWDESLRAPAWSGPPVFVHEDLMPANLLVRGGRLAAVIDWELAGLGDPACDLQPAWNLFDARSREVFRAELGPDDATWLRGRGWALWTGLAALPYYRETNPLLAENARYRIGEVLAEWAGRPARP